MPHVSLDELCVSLQDGRIYEQAAFANTIPSDQNGPDPPCTWPPLCIPVCEHPTAAFVVRQLGITAGSGPPGCSPWVLAHVPSSPTPRVPVDEEARFDPHDDTAYTRGQLSERYAGEYADSEVQSYWEGLPPWWRPPEFGCVSRSHFALTRNLCLHGVLRTARVLDAVLATDRIHYAPRPELAYHEAPQELGENATLSSPRIHCCCLEALAPCCFPGARVLDVGCGTGYVTAVLARLVGPSGRVVAVDVVEDYVLRTERNVRRDDPRLWDAGSVEVRLADGWWGSASDGPFDCIHVACSSPSVPEPLVAQLGEGGRLILPLGPPTPEWQSLTVVTRAGGGLSTHVVRPVRYVTMVHPCTEARGAGQEAEAELMWRWEVVD